MFLFSPLFSSTPSPSPFFPFFYLLTPSSSRLSIPPSLHLSSDLYKSLQSGSHAALPPHLQLAFSGKFHTSSARTSLLLPYFPLPFLHLCCCHSLRHVDIAHSLFGCKVFFPNLSACFNVSGDLHACVNTRSPCLVCRWSISSLCVRCSVFFCIMYLHMM